jgi:hypothetical protein
MSKVELAKVEMPLTVVANREVDGIEMGVLSDGTPFLGARGLARICGVMPSVIIEWANEWSPTSTKPRDRKIAEILAQNGVQIDAPFRALTHEGKPLSAFPDSVCIAVIEYYAFDQQREQAQTAFRTLARRSLREFIYSALGYDPAQVLAPHWREFQDRMTLNSVPRGYFSVFREIAEIAVSAIQHGLRFDSQTLPDISVGKVWAIEWKNTNGEVRWGPRRRHPHVFPSYFPQAQATVEPWIYPIAALGQFRSWLQEVYLPEKYPRYIEGKVNSGAIQASRAELLLKAVLPAALTDGELADDE